MLLWGNQLFPDDLNLYDSLGEFYQNSGQKDTAMKYYQLFKSKLIGRKNKLSSEEYNRLMSGIESRIDYLKNHMSGRLSPVTVCKGYISKFSELNNWNIAILLLVRR